MGWTGGRGQVFFSGDIIISHFSCETDRRNTVIFMYGPQGTNHSHVVVVVLIRVQLLLVKCTSKTTSETISASPNSSTDNNNPPKNIKKKKHVLNKFQLIL